MTHSGDDVVLAEEVRVSPDRRNRIEEWWAGLSLDHRAHARQLVMVDRADIWLTESLRAADIWLVSSAWSSVPRSWMTHIPRDVADFIESQAE